MQAIAYLRTSSAANLDGDSASRQNQAIMRFASQSRIAVNSCFWDAAVSGTDPIETRPGFAALLRHVRDSGINTVLVEDPSRFARSVIAQELGVLLLSKAGVKLLTTSGQDLTDDSDPARVMMRQVVGAFAQYEKTKVVDRLRAGRHRVRTATGKCEGRKKHIDVVDGLAREARRLARRNPKSGKRRPLRMIASELAALGFVSSSGKPFSPSVVQRIIT